MNAIATSTVIQTTVNHSSRVIAFQLGAAATCIDSIIL